MTASPATARTPVGVVPAAPARVPDLHGPARVHGALDAYDPREVGQERCCTRVAPVRETARSAGAVETEITWNFMVFPSLVKVEWALNLHPVATRMGGAWTAPEPTLESPRWFVVRTKAKREEYALRQLERRGVTTFLPRVLEPGHDQVGALFPGYLFVQVALLRQYHRVVWTPGVRTFVAFGAIPTPLPDAAVWFIRANADADGVIRPAMSYRAGDRVQIRSGPLAGLVAVVETPCPQRGRVKVLLDFLRHGTSAEVPVALVDRM
jgi:transcription antitermination factor NusG